MSYWLLYLITRIDSLKGALCGFTFISWFLLVAFLIVSIILFVSSVVGTKNDRDAIANFVSSVSKFILPKNCLRILVCSVVILQSMYLFTPSLKEIAVIYTVPKLLNNEEVKKLPDNLARLFNAKTEAWIEEITSGR